MSIGIISVLLFPGEMQFLKMLILLILLVYGFTKFGMRIHSKYFYITIIICMYGLCSFFIGYISGNPGAVDEFKLYVIWPALGYILSMINWSPSYYIVSYKTYEISIWLSMFVALTAYAEIFITGQSSVSQIYKYFFGMDYYLLGINEGRWDIASLNINVLIFASLYYFSLFIYLGSRGGRFSILNGILLFGLILLMIISGRRAWYVSFGIVGVLSFLYFSSKKINSIIKYAIYVPVIFVIFQVLFIQLEIDFSYIYNDIIDGFDFEGSYSGSLRNEQFHAMLKEFYHAPLFGNGLGYVAVESIRNIDQPWQYELSYMKILMSSGAVGFLLYTLTLAVAIYDNNKINREYVYIIPAIAGYLFCNATNPYLYKFDDLYVIFILLILIGKSKRASRFSIKNGS